MNNIYHYILFTLLLPVNSYAQYWSFSEPVDVSPGYIEKVYHHLESAGRRNIAVSSNTIAVVWEDNRNENPAIYLALKNKKGLKFTTDIKISGNGEAFEPGIASLSDNRFAISWEEDGNVFVRVIDTEQLSTPKLGPMIKLPTEQAMQAGVATDGDQLFISLSEPAGRYNQIRLIQLDVDHTNLSVLKNCLVDLEPVKNDQFYPTAVIVDQRIMVAWEDRRAGHTIIMGTLSQMGDYCKFPQPQRISKRQGTRKLPYGKGHGVSRVALGQYGKSQILAAWADKQNFREGYDIVSAVLNKTGNWSSNEPVQDDFGGFARQWHTTVAGHTNDQRMVAWTDERENQSDIFYSWFEDGEWSEDTPVPGASGTGEQTHPSIIFDDQGNIHIAWIVRKEVGGTTQLRYLLGRFTPASK